MNYITESMSLLFSTYALFLVIERLFIYRTVLHHSVIALHVVSFISAATLLLNNVYRYIYIYIHNIDL